VRGIPFSSGSSVYVYSYFFGAMIIPCLTLFLLYRYINYEQFFKSFFIVVVSSNLLLLCYLLSSDGTALVEMMAGRAFIESENKNDSVSTFLNPIYISQTGALLVISIVNLLLRNVNFKYKPFFFILGIIGFINVILGASRGPFLFMIICIAISVIIYFYRKPKSLILYFKLFLFIFATVFIFWVFIVPFVDKHDVFLFKRIEAFFESRVNKVEEERDFLMASALDQFFESPIIGDQYVMKDGHGYPHNFFVEVLMSLGIFGMCLFLFLFMGWVHKVYKILMNSTDNNVLLFVNVGIFFFLSGLTSGSIFVNPEIWLSVGLILVLPSFKTNYLHSI
jgi:O-antigen ligase